MLQQVYLTGHPQSQHLFGSLSFQFSAANDWNELQKSLKLETYISRTNFKHQQSEQLTDRCSYSQPICKQPIQSTYLIPILFLFYFLLFCTPVFLLAHHHLHIYHSNVNLLNCNYFATMAYLLPSLSMPFADTVHRLIFIVLVTVRLFVPCVTLCCLCRTALIYLGQVAVDLPG